MTLQSIILQYIKKSALKNHIPEKEISLIYLTKKQNISHYQINGIIKIAKNLNMNVFELSQLIMFDLQSYFLFKKIKFCNPGFINIFLNKIWLTRNIEKIIHDKNFGTITNKPKKIVIDYSSPNMAKEMHVGHLRSTILGDVMARILEFIGNDVIRMNHIGDWGKPFGMLIQFIKEKYSHSQIKNISLQEIEKCYKTSKEIYKQNLSFKEKSKQCLIYLKNKNQKYTYIWKKIIHTTMEANKKIYKLLNITLKDKHIFGESFYIPMIPELIQDLQKKKIAIEKNNKIIIYINEIKNKKGQSMGVIIKKNNNFLYSTIDLACLKYRIEKIKADKIIYYTDIRQTQHIKQLQIIAQKSGYIHTQSTLEHHTFGMVLSKDNKPFQTRSGKLIKLKQLINKSIKKSKNVIKNKNPNLRNKKIKNLSKIIGISAIKYADLSHNRTKNYIFNWNKMISFNGNTAPYIQYTYTRIQSIIKKSHVRIKCMKTKMILKKKIEILLSIKILQFQEIIQYVAKTGTPHILCEYLFNVSSLFSILYEKCPIIYSQIIEVKKSRLKLSYIIGKIIKTGLNILGIPILKYM